MVAVVLGARCIPAYKLIKRKLARTNYRTELPPCITAEASKKAYLQAVEVAGRGRTSEKYSPEEHNRIIAILKSIKEQSIEPEAFADDN